MWDQISAKHQARKRRILEAAYTFQSEEEVKLKVDKILPKLDVDTSPRPLGLRNSHLRIWT